MTGFNRSGNYFLFFSASIVSRPEDSTFYWAGSLFNALREDGILPAIKSVRLWVDGSSIEALADARLSETQTHRVMDENAEHPIAP